jgi:DNA sulfur modification protein DndC
VQISTERLKIRPSNTFIRDVVSRHGQAILVLGTRKAESAARARRMTALEHDRVHERLSPKASLPNSLVYSPVEDWTSDDIWTFLMQVDNPWGHSNRDLLTLYQGASPDGECPLVVDTTTPSCGDSRFGCWTCTLVTRDRSMTAMILNDADHEWMLPLLNLRNALDVTGDAERDLRDFRRMNGRVQLFHGQPIPGPYTQTAREMWLRRLLDAQRHVRAHGPATMRTLTLISLAELEEIRRIWIIDKHEFEDRLPTIYEETLAEPYPGQNLHERLPLGRVELDLLADLCGEDRLHYETVRDLLDVERRHRHKTRRVGLYPGLERVLERGAYTGRTDAIHQAQQRQTATERASQPPNADQDSQP